MSYEIHNRHGALMVFDCPTRARDEIRKRGLKEAKLFRVTKTLEELPIKATGEA